jgi:hypothetical protein
MKQPSPINGLRARVKAKVYVFVVMHELPYDDGHEDTRMIGIFSTARRARDAVRKVHNKPGFRQYKRGFDVSKCLVDHPQWTEGFGGGRLARLLRKAQHSTGDSRAD